MTSTDDYQRQITLAENQIGETHGKMALVRQQLTEAAVTEMARWYDETASTIARRQSEKTKALGEGVSQVKSDIKGLVERAQQVVTERLAEVKWPDQDPTASFHAPSGRLPDDVENALRAAAAELGVVMARYGYDLDAIGRVGGSVTGEDVWWSTWPTSGSTRFGGNAGFRGPGTHYPYHPPYSADMKRLVIEYDGLCRGLADTRNKLRTAKRELEEHEAGNLWNDA